MQTSADGVTWSSATSVSLSSGETAAVLVRGVATWTGTATPVGFASLTWQPVLGNVRPGIDSVQPFADQGNNTNGGSVVLDASPLDGPFGRISPFGATGPSGTQRYAATAHANNSGGAPDGDYLRISRNDITRWMGTGPTTGAAAVNNFNGAGGIANVQKPFGLINPSVDPPFNGNIADVVIFQFSLQVGGVAGGVTHVIDLLAPTDGMSRNSTTGTREASWFDALTDNSGRMKGAVEVLGGSITVTPAPGAMALLIGGLATAARGRRRRPCE